MFRKATVNDLDRIAEIYDEIHTETEAGRLATNWKRHIYPTRQTAQTSIAAGDMFVEEFDSMIVASARINREQLPEYALAAWNHDAPADQVMVLHTLCVSPCMQGSGFGKQFVDFYERYAREHNCPYLRIDTNECNAAARKMYEKLGYTEVSIISCIFNGIPDTRLVCLEKTL